ncbi:DegQ family serine endoprotease [Ectothiorhodospiraceae bacterium BW-2]|nr:DegQ family serine endoprotease [Ectothiorhodospiraceae bacterium BW-2]
MLERAVPAVVNIVTSTTLTVQQNPLLSDPFFRFFFDLPQMPQQHKSQSLGSGVVIDAKQGLVITNNHVIADADEISLNLADGRTLSATLIGADAETDIALLQVSANNLNALPLGDSAKLRVGDFVIAIGNPFGLGQTVTSGIVSALGRSGLGIEGYENFIQTDASINPGNSGGALVNLRGELIGINTAILSKSGGNVGIGFAIPVNMAREITAQLRQYGEVRRGRLGINAQDITPELASAFHLDPHQLGAVVTQISRHSPADKAGLRIGDIIIRINDTPVRSVNQIRTLIGLQRIGQRIQMTIMREGRQRQLEMVVEMPEVRTIDGAKVHPKLKGVTFAQQSELTAGGEVNFIAFAKVDPNAIAYRHGLREGDILTQINRQPIQTLAQLQQAGQSRNLLINIQRGNEAFFLVIR